MLKSEVLITVRKLLDDIDATADRELKYKKAVILKDDIRDLFDSVTEILISANTLVSAMEFERKGSGDNVQTK